MASRSLQHPTLIFFPKQTKSGETWCYSTPFSSQFFNPKANRAPPSPGVSLLYVQMAKKKKKKVEIRV